MIHYVSGRLAKLTGSYAVVDCGGVGFKIGISFSTGAKLSPLSGKNVLLYTYMAVSEDNMSLYGFFEEDELELFKMLISVSGVGPKGAMSILGTLSPDELRSAVAHGDAKTIASAQGIGLKTAQKLIIELKDKLGAGSAEIPASSAANSEKVTQVVDTLALYGFPRAKVIETLKKLDTSLSLEELLSQTLRILGKESGR
ncbi:MAG: Holliday junction branch migration protein RuvA [Clostridia bacterium]|nr:Holliday junction branch migration protein RuvA [Clostridia bacterium]